MPDFDFDPLGENFRQDPYEVYRQLREMEGPFFYEGQEMWLLSRYDDVAAAACDSSLVRSLRGFETEEELAERQRAANFHDMPYHERFVQFSLLDSDGALHRRLRRQVFGALQARNIASLEPAISSFVQALIDDLKGRDEIDFVNDFALHIPGFVIGRLLGAPAEDCSRMRVWSEDVVRYFDVNRTAKAKEQAERATREFHDYLLALKALRIRSPADDLMTKMIRDEADGAYSEDEFISTCMLILMAGHGSSIDALGSGMHVLLKNPDALEVLQKHPGKLPNAIQEMFRFEAPLPFFHRHATRDISLAGRTFGAGTTFGLLYGAANRDSGAFEQADVFDIERQPNRHLAFGMGAHLCLGNALARLTMRVVFGLVFRNFSRLDLAQKDVAYKPGLSVRGPEELPIAWAAA